MGNVYSWWMNNTVDNDHREQITPRAASDPELGRSSLTGGLALENIPYIRHMQQRLDELETKVQHLEQSNATLTLDKQSLLARFSEIAAMKLKDGNPNITDLSDSNRPEKLAEQFSELYDNQWTDSFELLTTKLKMKDKDTTCTLLDIVQVIYAICLSKAEGLDKQMHATLALYLGQEYVSKGDENYRAFTEKVMYSMREFRGQNYIMSLNDVKKDIKQVLRENVDKRKLKLCKAYISECSRVCWLMCTKNPPMYLESESGILFNKDIYLSYTTSGPYIAYVVWPVLYLYNNGPIMKKGVAQGTIMKPTSAKAEDSDTRRAEEVAPSAPHSTLVDKLGSNNDVKSDQKEVSDVRERKRRNSDPLSVKHPKVHNVDTGRLDSTSLTLKSPNKAEEFLPAIPRFIKADQTLKACTMSDEV